MAEVSLAPMTDWPSKEFRQKIIDEIDKTKLTFSVPVQIASSDIENKAFSSANNKDDYLNNVNKLLLSLQEYALKNEETSSGLNPLLGNITPAPVYSGVHLGVGSISGGSLAECPSSLSLSQDPINALQHLTKQNLQVPNAAAGAQQQQLQQQQYQQLNQQQASIRQQTHPMNVALQQRLQFPYVNPVPSGPRQLNSQGQLKGDVMMMNSQQQHARMISNQMMQQNAQFPGLSHTGQYHLPIQQSNQRLPLVGQSQIAPLQTYTQVVLPHQLAVPQQQQQVSLQPSPSGGGTGPGSSNNLMIPSPANLNIPSQSPSQGNMTSPARMSMPSPGSHLNTPGNPNSVSASISGNVQLTPSEEIEYLQKWEQLQKYIEPLKKMISRIDKDEDRKMDLNKMKNLLDILFDKNKRLPLQTLLKCESVLERQLQQSMATSTTAFTTPSTAVNASIEGMQLGQNLYDAISNQINNPNLNNILRKTFGASSKIIQSVPQIIEDSESKKQKYNFPPFLTSKNSSDEDEENNSKMENSVDVDNNSDDDEPKLSITIKRELAQLHPKFIVGFDLTNFVGSNVKRLVFKLYDLNLPTVPPLHINLPANYPDESAILVIREAFYATTFLTRVKDNLNSKIRQISGIITITTILQTWESAIEKAYNDYN